MGMVQVHYLNNGVFCDAVLRADMEELSLLREIGKVAWVAT
jgi:hypothetical protein